MGSVIATMAMSLDGFIAGSDEDRLHDWVFKGTVPVTVSGYAFHVASDTTAEIFKTLIARVGSVILGKAAFKSSNEHPPFQLPSFVLTHTPQDPINRDGTPVTFVTDGIESALKQAKAIAGDKSVYIFGGANTIQQYLNAGLVDEMHIDLVPILLGKGPRLFDHIDPRELEIIRVAPSQGVTHLLYRVIK
jgi:dihydrofolate reductase